MLPQSIPWNTWHPFMSRVLRSRGERGRRKRSRAGIRPGVQALEARVAPAVFNVGFPAGVAYPGTSVATLGDAIGQVYGGNNSDPNNTINLWGPGTYTIRNEQIVQSSHALTIAGHGAGAVISAGGNGYVFSIDASVKFEDVTITGGDVQVQSDSSPPVGAGLNVRGARSRSAARPSGAISSPVFTGLASRTAWPPRGSRPLVPASTSPAAA